MGRRLAAALVAAVGTAAGHELAAPRALAENNGLAVSAPLMGWSSWSFLRSDPTAAKIEAEASALKSSGLAAHGYDYVNLDDFWYQYPGSQGPNVDQYGRWVTDAGEVPGQWLGQRHPGGRELRAQPGPEVRPVRDARASPSRRSRRTPPSRARPTRPPRSATSHQREQRQLRRHDRHRLQQAGGAGVHQLLGRGVRVLGRGLRKLDGVGSSDLPDVQAWSAALRQTGRPMAWSCPTAFLSLTAPRGRRCANGWRTTGDIECYCGSGGSSYPLTDWANVESRFGAAAKLAALRRSRRLERLRLDRGRERQQRRPDRGGAADPAVAVVAGQRAADPGHRPHQPGLRGPGPAGEQRRDRGRPGRHPRRPGHRQR